MIWYIPAYLLGVIASWFLIAYQRDNVEYESDKWSVFLILLSWALITALLTTALISIFSEWVRKFKIFNPSLKYFKKK